MRQEVKMRVVPWWLILIQGIALIILGILFLTNPASTALAVVTVLGIYWLVSGILGIIGIFLNSHNWFWKLLMGILGIVAGVLILQHPVTSTLVVGSALVLWLGLLGIMIGVVEIIRGITGEGWAEVILGIVSIILGGLLLANFWGVTISLPWSLGILSLIGGAVAIWRAFAARGIQKDMEAGTDELTNQYRAAVAGADAKLDAAAASVRNAGGAAAAATAAAATRAATSVDKAVDATVDAAEDAYDAAADTVGDAVDAVADVPSRMGNAVEEMVGYDIPAAAGALTAEDKLAITSWAREKGIDEAEIQRIMASPYGDLLSRGKTPVERAALARDLGVDEKKILTYLNLADLQRINGVGVVYAYLLEESGVDTVKELATRNPANLTAKMAEVNAVRGITKRVPPQGEVENWVAEAKTMPPMLEY